MGDKAYKDLHRKLGLCLNCSDPVYKNRTLCLKHLRTNVIAQRKYQLKIGDAYLEKHRQIKQHRRDTHCCERCGAPLPDGWTYINCCNCNERIYFRRYENADTIV